MLTFGQIGLLAIGISIVALGAAFGSQYNSEKLKENNLLYAEITFCLYWLGVALAKGAATDAFPGLSLWGYLLFAFFVQFALTAASAYLWGMFFKMFNLKRAETQGRK